MIFEHKPRPVDRALLIAQLILMTCGFTTGFVLLGFASDENTRAAASIAELKEITEALAQVAADHSDRIEQNEEAIEQLRVRLELLTHGAHVHDGGGVGE